MKELYINNRRDLAVDTSRPVAEVLHSLATTRPVWPSEQQLLKFFGGREAIMAESEPGAQWNERWYHHAWWGYYAARILFRYVIAGKSEEVSSLFATADRQPLQQALAAKRGVILLGNHLGPYPAIDGLLSRYPELDILTLTSNKMRQQPGMLHVTSMAEQKASLVKCLLHLRKGGVVRIAPDGRVAGESKLFFDFMGMQVRMAGGAGELAYLSGAETFWCSASWTAVDQIRLHLLRMPFPGGRPREEAIAEWYLVYLRHLAKQMVWQPQDIGFRSGHLLLHRGRLKHFPTKTAQT